MDSPKLIYAPRAVKDLERMETKYGNQVLDDLELLESGQCPKGKIKKLRGVDFMELKTGDYRSIYRKENRYFVVVRVVNRRDLDRVVGNIDPIAFKAWLKQRLAS